MKRIFAMAVVAAGLMVGSASAQSFTLDFTGSGGTFDFDANSGTYTDPTSGIQLDFSVFIGGVAGDADDELNATSSSFGVNESGSGDATSALDTDNGVEEIRITFTVPGTVASATLVDFTTVDVSTGDGFYDINDGSAIAVDIDETTEVNTGITSGTTIDFVAGDADGFGLTGLTIDYTLIPEPASLALLGLGGLLIAGRNRRSL